MSGLATHLSQLQCHLRHLERRKEAQERATRPASKKTLAAEEIAELFERMDRGE